RRMAKRDVSAAVRDLDFEHAPPVASDPRRLARALGLPERRVRQAGLYPTPLTPFEGKPPALTAGRLGQGARGPGEIDAEGADALRRREFGIRVEEAEPSAVPVGRDDGRDPQQAGPARELVDVEVIERAAEEREAVPLLDQSRQRLCLGRSRIED